MTIQTKRLFFYIALPLLAAVLLLNTPKAEAASGARIQLEATINDVLTELKKPELKDPYRQQEVLTRVEQIILRLFDFNELSMRTVGPNWKIFSDDQKKRFTLAFEDLLRETYLEKLQGYNGEAVNYTGENASKDGERVEIQTSIDIKNKAVPVSYRMLEKNHWVVYDVIIEGVSMVQNYRSQFQDLLSKGDAEALITLVESKAREMEDQNKQQRTQ